jgi:ATP/maltotriose-dependent transcriptional regulator MalT
MVGKVYCSLITACEELGDYQRAFEWTEAGQHWADTNTVAVFPGLCRVHRAEMLQLRGEWARAEEEARRAYTELCDVHAFNAGAAYYAIGEIHRRLGDLAAADDAFARAAELGREPQPGLALLRLAQGRADAALAAIRRAVAAEEHDLGRAKMLPAFVEIAIAAGATAEAEAASADLDAISQDFATPGLRAAADLAAGRVALAGPLPADACAPLRRSLHAWQDLDLPYEMGTTRLLLAQACRAAGDDDGADASLAAAIALFDRLGIASLAARARAARTPAELPRNLTAREAEVLTLVAAGRTNKDIAAVLHLSDKTVARHLANIFVKIDVSSRSAATRFAFEHGIVPTRSA